MEAGFIALSITLVVVSFFVGVIIGSRNKSSGSKGILYVDCSRAGHDPGLFLNLTVPINDVVTEKQIVFDVDIIGQNSR